MKIKATASFPGAESKSAAIELFTPCFCDRDITEKELKKIVKELRKKSGRSLVFKVKDLKNKGIIIHSHYDNSKFYNDKVYIKDGVYLYYHGSNDGYYNIETYKFFTKEKPDLYIDEAIFKSSRSEKIKTSEATYKNFAEHLNCTFSMYYIDSCIRKIHFIAQCFHETGGFIDTSEKGGKDSYRGGKDFKGRGLIHITHDDNYLKYYDSTNVIKYFHLYQGYKKHKPGEGVTDYIKRKNKEKVNHGFPDQFIESKLKPFAKKLANNLQYSCYSAGWFWDSNDINKFATMDDSKKVSMKINKYDTTTFSDRKDYTNYLKDIFDYENCKNKK
ncbi:hypothetical protein PG911_08655 [Tenacibaculum ovolyticum]|uniref:hypothetical protein n=1 Tax=Tenacibaculum ovolyticum TaxID=104270 RepID=UPI0022F3DEC5|nr:hypothetical protein [Tenacibaculum ovolyticum]WBX78315.1 hypothetical protein PG911_08655 [Tenacibaculum ovolyticum]